MTELLLLMPPQVVEPLAAEQHPISTPEEPDKKEHHLKAWQFKPGQSGNPSGRPKGVISLKEYAKKYLQELDEEGKLEFMKGLSKDVIWKMAEGNPETKADITSAGKPIIQIASEIATKHELITSSSDNSL